MEDNIYVLAENKEQALFWTRKIDRRRVRFVHTYQDAVMVPHNSRIVLVGHYTAHPDFYAIHTALVARGCTFRREHNEAWDNRAP